MNSNFPHITLLTLIKLATRPLIVLVTSFWASYCYYLVHSQLGGEVGQPISCTYDSFSSLWSHTTPYLLVLTGPFFIFHSHATLPLLWPTWHLALTLSLLFWWISTMVLLQLSCHWGLSSHFYSMSSLWCLLWQHRIIYCIILHYTTWCLYVGPHPSSDNPRMGLRSLLWFIYVACPAIPILHQHPTSIPYSGVTNSRTINYQDIAIAYLFGKQLAHNFHQAHHENMEQILKTFLRVKFNT